jgi:hypothetical protein
MFSSFFEGVGDVLNAVSEVIAPSVDTPLEDFKTHWNAIRYYYNDQNCNPLIYLLNMIDPDIIFIT